MNFIGRKLLSIIALLALGAQYAMAETPANWVYMDLGEVIVTGNSTIGYKFVPGALQLIADLKATGHKVALVSNIPETWGTTCAEKYAGLKTFLDTRMIEPPTLDWTILDRVVLPPFDRYRKPKPFVFMTAMANACPGRAIFMGESEPEVAAAQQLGFAAINTKNEIQLPGVQKIQDVLNTDFRFTHPQDCGFDAILNAYLEPQDVGHVSGCVITPGN